MKAISGNVLKALFIVSILFNVSADEAVLGTASSIEPATIPRTDLSIDLVYVLPANAAGVAQVFPVPGGSASASVYVIACESSGSDKITQAVYELRAPGGVVLDESVLSIVPERDDVAAILGKTVSADLLTQSAMDSYMVEIFDEKVCTLYKKAFTLSYTDLAGTYTVYAAAYGVDGRKAVKTASFEYASLMALEMDFSSLDFGELRSGVENAVSGDAVVDERSKPTLRNIGNIVANVVVLADSMHTNCSDGTTGVLPAGALSARIGGVKKTLSEEGTLFEANLLPGAITSADFFLAAPEKACGGKYYGKISLEGVAVQVITSTTTTTTVESTTTQPTTTTTIEPSTTTTVEEATTTTLPETSTTIYSGPTTTTCTTTSTTTGSSTPIGSTSTASTTSCEPVSSTTAPVSTTSTEASASSTGLSTTTTEPASIATTTAGSTTTTIPPAATTSIPDPTTTTIIETTTTSADSTTTTLEETTTPVTEEETTTTDRPHPAKDTTTTEPATTTTVPDTSTTTEPATSTTSAPEPTTTVPETTTTVEPAASTTVQESTTSTVPVTTTTEPATSTTTTTEESTTTEAATSTTQEATSSTEETTTTTEETTSTTQAPATTTSTTEESTTTTA